MSTWYVSAVIIRNAKVWKYVKLLVKCLCSVWCSEQQKYKKKNPQSQQVAMRLWMGEKRPDELRLYWKHEPDLSFPLFLSLTYSHKPLIRLPMSQSLLALLIAHSLSFTHPGYFKAFKKLHSYPAARLPLLSPPSPAAALSSVFRCWQKTIWDRVSFHFTHLPHQWEWLFPPHTHPTRLSHPLIYRWYGGLSWQRPSCDVFLPMCMALLSVKLCVTINKTGLSVLKYRKWVGERVNCD